MASFNEILMQMITLFILIIVGYVVSKLDILDLDTNKKISAFILKVSCPALILNSVMSGEITANSKTIISMTVCAICLYAFLVIISFFIPKLMDVKGNDKYSYMFMTIFSNVGFMGFPVIESIYGTGAIFFASIFNMPFNLLAYTIGIDLSAKSGGKIEKMTLKKCFNAGVISSLLAIIIFVFNIKFPAFIVRPVALVGSLTTPLSMIVIGVSLSAIRIRDVFDSFRMYVFTVVKLVIIPILVYLILKPFNLEPIVLGVTVVIAAMPVATNAVIMATEFEGNVELATKGVFLTTLISVFTIPVVTLFL